MTISYNAFLQASFHRNERLEKQQIRLVHLVQDRRRSTPKPISFEVTACMASTNAGANKIASFGHVWVFQLSIFRGHEFEPNPLLKKTWAPKCLVLGLR